MTENGAPLSEDDPFPDDMEPPELLMEATVRVLAKEGYQGLTLRKVAEKAGKNRGLVHYYFESKSDLLRSLLDHILEGTKRLIGVCEEEDVIDQLWTTLQFHAYGPGGSNEAGHHYYMAIVQLQALAAHDTAIRQRFTRNFCFMRDLITSIIEEGIARDVFRPVDPGSTALFLLVTIDGARNADLTLDLDSSREITLATLEQFVSDFLIAEALSS